MDNHNAATDYHDAATQQRILDFGNRQEIISWLVWNDANGVYSDEDCKLQGWRPLFLSEAQALMREILSR